MAVYDVRPDLLPGGFHGIDMMLLAAGFFTFRLLRARPSSPRAGYSAIIIMITPLVLSAMAGIAAVIIERGPNRIHDIAGIGVSVVYMMNWAIQFGFETPGAYVSLVQSMWLVATIAQLTVLAWLLSIVVRTASKPARAGLLLTLVGVVLSFAFAVSPGPLQPIGGYFSLGSRAWPFALGGTLAYVWAAAGRTPRILRAAGGWIGLAGFIVTAFANGPSATNLSFAALPACLFAILLIVGSYELTPAWSLGRAAQSRAAWTLGVSALATTVSAGVAVGILAYFYPPGLYLPGADPVRDWIAVGLIVLSVGIAQFIAVVLTRSVVTISKRWQPGLRSTRFRRDLKVQSER